MRNIKKILKVGVALTPLIIGVVGYLRLPGLNISSSIYNAIRLYSLNTDTEEINFLIEIARWTAPIATMSVIFYFIKDIWISIIYKFRSLKRDSCSVYGENQEALFFLNTLGSDGIKGNINRPFPTKNHVFFTDNVQGVIEAIDSKSINKLLNDVSKNCQFFFRFSGNAKIVFSKANVHTFSIEENCSLRYWEDNLCRPDYKVAIIGGNILCDAILDEGLQVNIFGENQKIEYHVWSDTKYNKIRKYLKEALEMTNDQLIIYDNSWEDSLSILEKMDRIIVCYDDKDNLNIGFELLNFIPNVKIHIYSYYGIDLDKVFDNERIFCFGRREDLINSNVIIRESLREDAKRIHEYYRKKYSTISKWEELSVFHIESNLSSAGYFKVVERLYTEGIDIDQLKKLEHIRWCRFHYLKNWKYGIRKDYENKTHPCLVPFMNLSFEEQEKDKENIELALKISGLI